MQEKSLNIKRPVSEHSEGNLVSMDSLEDGVGVQVDAHHVRGGVVQVEVAGVDAHDEGHRRQQHVGHLQRTQRDVGTDPAQGEAHLWRPEGEGSYINTIKLNQDQHMG